VRKLLRNAATINFLFMIPVRLEVKNFLPYRSPDVLRFEGIHLACLTGVNGAGKSSLLDAITWALWGKARAKRDEELIHLGQNDMYIQLDFEQEGAIYQVIRRRARGKRGQGSLDLFILKEDGKRTTITEPSMRQTQSKINDLLRLDYETFVHSAFLQQGKADAFTTKSPAERKKILSDILGLDQWALYEDVVKERLKEISNQLHYFEQRIAEIDAELSRKPGLQADLEEATKNHAEAEATREAAETRLKEVEHAPGELTNAQENKAERERRLREHERDLEEVESRITRQLEQIADYQEIINAEAEIETGYQTLQDARDTSRELNEKLKQIRSLDDERYELRSQLNSARTRLESERDTLIERIQELEAVSGADYETELTEVRENIAELQAKELERDSVEGQINDLRADHAKLGAKLDSITNEGKELGERLEQLKAAPADAATCPLCGQPLSPKHRSDLIGELNREIEGRRADFTKVRENRQDIETDIAAQRQLVATMTDELSALQGLLSKAGELESQKRNAAESTRRLQEDRARLAAVEAELENETYASDVRERLAMLDGQKSELGYDEDSHDHAQKQLEEHDQYEKLFTRLSIARESLPGLEQGLEDARTRKERLEAAKLEAENEIVGLDAEINRLAALVEEYHQRDEEVRRQRTLERTAYERLVSARQALEALKSQAERKTELVQRRTQTREQEALYNELKRAFGKNGIPAMIIETAIPELEATANTLLARMTDGRMHLRLNTQREKVTGGIAETLDIEIADELGTRNYEMYSGGEAFRINFAIRVALSQMLARRAGAHLRTLFIDEGFGTQDDQGRTKLVEAINAIQEEFDLILVITHIDELRDSFPVHIMVDKTSSGSRIALQ